MSITEQYMRQIHADQGGEADFETWLNYVSEEPEEFAHEEAKEFVAMRTQEHVAV